ncbi:lipoprotein signal peptidase [Legionella geestiana]|uniref:Lipoprotein signal peptidase n=1 Tax=Legionella geestiana TaxID=45065 RepID=A0A0W0TW63_9GAMM|nr:signal peptidase II [Legionella geestiana]KTC99676.1 lipoprotein signal peptidase [Legionella geestiana]QBS13201.1 lipoprotein signal peptidase [Legionella geestiana]QDQ39117.1 lipoprotein signal peptidase [Legionella geestiana]STX54277.1 signal peptidase II [Legionella geestiana]
MKKWPWLLLSLGILVLDQLSKYWVGLHFTPWVPYPVFSGFNITLAWNNGAAFSFLSGAGEWHRWFFVVFSLLMSVVFVIWLRRLPENAVLQPLAIALLLGGAAGNLIDRLFFGYVVDFLEVYYQNWHWPVFNIADSAIFVGAVLLMLDLLRNKTAT